MPLGGRFAVLPGGTRHLGLGNDPGQVDGRLEAGRRVEQIPDQRANVGRGAQGRHLDLVLVGFHLLGGFALDRFLQLLDVAGKLDRKLILGIYSHFF